MTRTRSAQPAGKNLSLVRDKAAKSAIILVVDPAHASFAERAAFLWSSHFQLILVVVVIVATSRCLHCQLFFAHRRSADFVLVQSDEIANDAIVELERSLIFRQNIRLCREARDYVVAVFLGADRIGELAPAPMAGFRQVG